MNKHQLKSLLRESQLVLQQYRLVPHLSNQKETTLVFICDGSIQHGGFVDRLKGIISFYYFAKINGWHFKLYYSHPFDLRVFFQEGDICWSVNTVEKTFPKARPIWEFDRPKVDINRLQKRFARGGIFHIYSNVDFLHQLMPETSKNIVQKHWGKLFKEIFRISPGMVETIESLLIHTSNPVGIHLRFTNLLGDFSDTPTLRLSPQQQDGLINYCVQQVGEVLKLNQNSSYFLFTDSIRFIEVCKSVYPEIRITPGVPQHTDQDREKSTDQDKTVLDFLLLTRMCKIYLIKHKLMYNSNFSRYASYINSVPFELVTQTPEVKK
jgi:hypothetical protein